MKGALILLALLQLVCVLGFVIKPSRQLAATFSSVVEGTFTASLSNKDFVECNNIGIKKTLRWGDDGKFSPSQEQHNSVKQSSLLHHLLNSFLPGGSLTKDYYTFTTWRLAQRFVSATTSVFGAQALLLALGFKRDKIGIAAATTWVLKDALGKVSRILWASHNGRKFDSDAKKWRFRSSILFATGSAFEIFTYLAPSLFLLSAAVANALKQMAMVTSSATRNAIYKSFARASDNIGDITAKGEAQIAVIDLLGMLAGIAISKIIDANRWKIAMTFLVLSVVDLLCIFKEIKSVVFQSLNYERAAIVLRDLIPHLGPADNYCDPAEGGGEAEVGAQTGAQTGAATGAEAFERGDVESAAVSFANAFPAKNVWLETSGKRPLRARVAAWLGRVTSIIPSPTTPSQDRTLGADKDVDTGKEKAAVENVERAALSTPQQEIRGAIGEESDCELELPVALTPEEVAKVEPVFFPTIIGEKLFKTWSTVDASAEVLRRCLELFQEDKLFVTLNVRIAASWMDAKTSTLGWGDGGTVGCLRSVEGVPVIVSPQVLLREDATAHDIFRALIIVHKLLHELGLRSSEMTADQAGAGLQKINVLPLRPLDSAATGGLVKNMNVPAFVDFASNVLSRSTTPSNSVNASITGVADGSAADAVDGPPSMASIMSSPFGTIDGTEADILMSLGLSEEGLVGMVRQARAFERKHVATIGRCLEAVGWDATRFMFGSVRARVDWRAQTPPSQGPTT